VARLAVALLVKTEGISADFLLTGLRPGSDKDG